MALEIKQSLRLSQQLVMTPQLQQAIKLLQLNRLELANMINTELTENPMLEEVTETLENPEGLPEDANRETPEANGENPETGEMGELKNTEQTLEKSKQEEFDWESYIDDVNNNQPQVPTAKISPEDVPSFENMLTKTVTLPDHLIWQLKLASLMETEYNFGLGVIGNLDEDGYLKASLEDLAKESGLEAEDAEEVLKVIQHFDPVGVASRTVQECLMVQASFLKPRDETVESIIRDHLSDLERKNYPAITRALKISMDEVITATKIIREFEPKPGRLFVEEDNTQYITPDIYVTKGNNGDFIILLNEDGLPKLRVSNYYKSVLSDSSGTGKSQTKDYIQDKLRSAIWLIRSIHNRQKTIYKVAESIVKRQKDFFEKGAGFLKPMILKDVATDISMHESTVSRVTSNKFMHTPVGIFELKFFFNSGINVGEGADIASESIKEKIRVMVSKEDPAKPLSDQRIVELLQAQNIDIARRTAAKYREMLGILSSSKRKKIF